MNAALTAAQCGPNNSFGWPDTVAFVATLLCLTAVIITFIHRRRR